MSSTDDSYDFSYSKGVASLDELAYLQQFSVTDLDGGLNMFNIIDKGIYVLTLHPVYPPEVLNLLAKHPEIKLPPVAFIAMDSEELDVLYQVLTRMRLEVSLDC